MRHSGNRLRSRFQAVKPMLAVVLLMFTSGCFVGALLLGGAATLVIKEGFIDEDTYAGVIRSTAGRAYGAATEVMDELCHKIVLERAFRQVTGTWQSSDLTVSVEDIGGGEISISVKARKYGLLADKETAADVFQRILLKIKA